MPLSSKNGDSHMNVIIDRMNKIGKFNSNEDDIYRSKYESTPSKLTIELSSLLTIETASRMTSHVRTWLIHSGSSLHQQLKKTFDPSLSLKTFEKVLTIKSLSIPTFRGLTRDSTPASN